MAFLRETALIIAQRGDWDKDEKRWRGNSVRPHPNPRWTELGRKWYALHVLQSGEDEDRSAVNDLIEQVGNPELRERPRREVDKLNKQKKGLT